MSGEVCCIGRPQGVFFDQHHEDQVNRIDILKAKMKTPTSSKTPESTNISSLRPQAEMEAFVDECASQLSSTLKTSVSHFDMFRILIELMKLNITHEQTQKEGRNVERRLQIEHAKKTAELYKAHGDATSKTNLSFAALGIVSSVLPILGYTNGQGILDTVKKIFTSLDGIDKDMFFKNAAKLTSVLAETNKMTEQIEMTFYQGEEIRSQHDSDIAKTYADQWSAYLQELRESWSELLRAIQQFLNMEYESAKKTYSAG